MTLHDFGRMVCERNQRLADKVEPHMTAEEKAEYLQFRGDLVPRPGARRRSLREANGPNHLVAAAGPLRAVVGRREVGVGGELTLRGDRRRRARRRAGHDLAQP